MKVLIVHNRYNTPGGEEAVVHAERDLLLEAGHQVYYFEQTNRHLVGIVDKVQTALHLSYSPPAYNKLYGRIKAVRPDIVHVHNFFPTLTPAVFYACVDAGAPVVHTLHNYRLLCPSGSFSINGKVDETALERGPYFAALKRPYRQSLLGSLAAARMISYHKARSTWQRTVDRFIVMTEFAKKKFSHAGLPAEKISVKPHSTTDPGESHRDDVNGVLFVGRLSAEKGFSVLMEAWRGLDIRLDVVGEDVQGYSHGNPNSAIRFHGALPKAKVREMMQRAKLLVFPSIAYESFGLVLIEAMACGLPVIASDIAGVGEIVDHNRTGILVPPGNSAALSAALVRMCDTDLRSFSIAARSAYCDRFTPERNYAALLRIYEHVVTSRCRTEASGTI